MRILVKVLTYTGLLLGGFLVGILYSKSSFQQQSTTTLNRGTSSISDSKKEVASAQAPIEKIKGNRNKKGELIYHVPGGQYYDRVSGSIVFDSEEEAQQAGYRRSLR